MKARADLVSVVVVEVMVVMMVVAAVSGLQHQEQEAGRPTAVADCSTDQPGTIWKVKDPEAFADFANSVPLIVEATVLGRQRRRGRGRPATLQTFRVRRVFKASGKAVSTGATIRLNNDSVEPPSVNASDLFVKRRRPTRCGGSESRPGRNMMRVILFMRSDTSPLMAPVQVSRNIVRILERTRNLESRGALPNPTLRVLKESSVPAPANEEGRSLSLRCSAVGQGPTRLKATWFKDNRKLQRTARIRPLRSRYSKSGKMSSTLRIRKLQVSDRGFYECRVRQLLGTTWTIRPSNQVQVEVLRSSPDSGAPGLLSSGLACPIKDFCLNGGSCLYYPVIGEMLCSCADGFRGQRCEFKDPYPHHQQGPDAPEGAGGAYRQPLLSNHSSLGCILGLTHYPC